MKPHKLSILCNTLESFDAQAEEHGEDSVWIRLTHEDVWEILHFIYNAEFWLDKYKWHDLIQHPDDLPKEWTEVLVYHEYYHWSQEKVLPEYGLGMVIGGRWHGEITTGRDVRILAWKYIEAPPEVSE